MNRNIKDYAKNGYRVFIVEDSDQFRKGIVDYLTTIKKCRTNEGFVYSVTSFTTGEEVLKNIHEKPEIVFLDYYLASMGYINNANGLSILKKIKIISPKTEVVMLRCQHDISVIYKLIEAGTSKYICKEKTAPLLAYELISETISNLNENRNDADTTES